MPVNTIVRVTWESGEVDDDLYVVTGRLGGTLMIKALSEVGDMTHYVRRRQLSPA